VTPRPGESVHLRFTKWGGGPHWEFAATVIDEDEHGIWVYSTPGTRVTRPGHDFAAPVDWVSLLPHERPWAASFYESPGHTRIYVDMCTVPVWDDAVVTMVDLDLDVILLAEGSLILDDEDEFDEHRVALAYPQDVVELARQSAQQVLTAVGDGVEPFLTVGHTRLAQARSGVGVDRRP
jgi:uncharacterized protein